MSCPVTIGLDFDNTIVCYDKAIRELAKKHFDLPARVKTKTEIKTYISNLHGNLAWTKFQGELYGPGMHFAEPYAGSIETIFKLSLSGFRILILSHRSRYPYAGYKYDLHEYAVKWLDQKLRYQGNMVIKKDSIFFFETKLEKILAITEQGCDYFLDDLPEIINNENFPKNTTGFLFDPNKTFTIKDGCINNWLDLTRILL